MENVNFTPKNNIELYLDNNFNIEVLSSIESSTRFCFVFDSLIFFNLLYLEYETIKFNKTKPLTVVNHLLSLDLTEYELYTLIHHLILLIDYNLNSDYITSELNSMKICREFILKEYNKLSTKLFPNEAPFNFNFNATSNFDFIKIKQDSEGIENLVDKIVFFEEQKTFYLQSDKKHEIKLFEQGISFAEKCELEIDKLKKIADLKTKTISINKQPIFKLSDKTGAKTDLIRVLNALYEIRLFTKIDGQIPTKQEFIETMGEYLGVDLSKYHTNLSQSLKNQPLEVNIKVFEDMKEATQNAHYQTKTK